MYQLEMFLDYNYKMYQLEITLPLRGLPPQMSGLQGFSTDSCKCKLKNQ